jgi:hypothetical protein
METVLSIALGIGLAAACGFRIFVPMTIMSLAVRAGFMTVGGNFEWVGSTPALVVLSVATVLEIGAYYIPWVDNLLDLVATPAAVVAGVLVSASTITGMSPVMHWTLAVIAGGGAAALVQGSTAVVRQVSAATTFGVGNPVVATVEAAGAVGMSLLAIVMPVLALTVVAVMLILTVRTLQRWRNRPQPLAA